MTKQPEFPRYIAFYSYRGGVGRTMAAVNVATRLALQGDRVFFLDLDLEAPGSSLILGCNPERAGFVEYVAEVLQGGKAPRFEDYFSRVPAAGGQGICLMPAGRLDESYVRRLDRLDLRSLFDTEKDGRGQDVLEALRHQIGELDPRPHYVVIDSRPGLSFLGALAARALARTVVLLFGLGPQGLDGLKRILPALRPGITRLIPVAAMVPASEAGQGDNPLSLALQTAEEILKRPVVSEEVLIQRSLPGAAEEPAPEAARPPPMAPPLELPFESSALHREGLFLGESSLAKAYDALTLAVRPGEDVYRFVENAKRHLTTPGGLASVQAELLRASQLDRTDPRVLLLQAHVAQIQGNGPKAVGLAEEAIAPDDERAWLFLAKLYDEKLAKDKGVKTKIEGLFRRTDSPRTIKLTPELGLARASSALDLVPHGTWLSSERPITLLEPIRAALDKALHLLGGQGRKRAAVGKLLGRIEWPQEKSAVRRAQVVWRHVVRERIPKDVIPALWQYAEDEWELRGKVVRFGDMGYGFLQSDDGEGGIHFTREDCTDYGREVSDFIPIGMGMRFVLAKSDQFPQRWWKAIRVDVLDDEALFRKAVSLYKKGRDKELSEEEARKAHESAIRCLDRAAEINSAKAHVFNLRNVVRHSLGLLSGDRQEEARMYNESLADVRRAIALDPDVATYWSNLAIILWNLASLQSGQPDTREESLQGFAKAIALAPPGAGHRILRAELLLELNRPGDAIADLQAALRIAPDRKAEIELLLERAREILEKPGQAQETRDQGHQGP